MNPISAAGVRPGGKQPFRLGEWQIVPSLHRMQRGEEERQLEPKVMQVLVFLAARPGDVVGHEELIDGVWGGVAVSGNVVTYSIAALRKALEDDWRQPRYIETISKSGYRLIMPVEPVDATPGIAVRPGADARGKHERRPLPLSPGEPAAGTRWVVAGLVLSLAVIAAWRLLASVGDGTPSPMLQPLPVTTLPGSEVQPTLSPDGNHVAFAWMRPGRADRDLYVMLIGAESPSPLATSEAHERSPAWTPDGLYVAYARWSVDGGDCGIYKIPAVGGTGERIADCPGRPIGNMSFSPDGKRLAVGASGPAGEPAQIHLIDLDSGTTRIVGDPPPGRQGDYYPLFSPDGRRLSFLRIRGDGLSDVYTVRPDGGDLRRVTFDARDVGGTAWSGDGATLYFSSYRSGPYTLWRVPAAGGEPTSVALSDHNVVSPSTSAGGDRLVYSKRIEEVNLWTLRRTAGEAGEAGESGESGDAGDASDAGDAGQADDPSAAGKADATGARRILSSSQWEGHPAFSPDGKRVAFVSDRSGSFELYSALVDGSELRRHTSFGGAYVAHPSWSPDGDRIAFDARPDGHADLWIVDAEGGTPRRLTEHPDDELSPSFSASGQALYFTSHRSGSWQIWRMPAAGGGAEMVTTEGGYRAIEGVDGELVYYSKYDVPGLWRRPPSGTGREELVLSGLSLIDGNNWVVRPAGVFFLHSASRTIYRYQPRSKAMIALILLPGDVPRQIPSLAVSADGTQLVWAQIDRREDDIYLVEGLEGSGNSGMR